MKLPPKFKYNIKIKAEEWKEWDIELTQLTLKHFLSLQYSFIIATFGHVSSLNAASGEHFWTI